MATIQTYNLTPLTYASEVMKQMTIGTPESLKRFSQLSFAWTTAEDYYSKEKISDRNVTVISFEKSGPSLEFGTHDIYQSKPEHEPVVKPKKGYHDPEEGGTAICAAAGEFGGGALRSGWNNEEMKLHECIKAIHLLMELQLKGSKLIARTPISSGNNAENVGEGYATPFMLKDIERFVKYPGGKFFGNQAFATNSIDTILKNCEVLEKPVKFDFIFIALSNLGNSAPEECVKGKAYKEFKFNRETKMKEPTTELSTRLRNWMDDKVSGLPTLQCSETVLKEEFAAIYRLALAKITPENPHPEITGLRVGTQAFMHGVQAVYDMYCLVSAITGVKFVFPDTEDAEGILLQQSAAPRIAQYKDLTVAEIITMTSKSLHEEMVAGTLIRHRE
jgi:hypothetical protein